MHLLSENSQWQSCIICYSNYVMFWLMENYRNNKRISIVRGRGNVRWIVGAQRLLESMKQFWSETIKADICYHAMLQKGKWVGHERGVEALVEGNFSVRHSANVQNKEPHDPMGVQIVTGRQKKKTRLDKETEELTTAAEYRWPRRSLLCLRVGNDGGLIGPYCWALTGTQIQ
jgi:hypothetical protein